MDNLGDILRRLRLEKELPLRVVAAHLDMDQAILSKIERGQRKATREHVIKLAEYFKVKDETLLLAWLSDKLVYELGDEAVAITALQLAEKKMEYKAILQFDRTKLLALLKKELKLAPNILKAWIYGSFSRGDDGPLSDVDIAIETEKNFSYFDLAEIQYQLKKRLNREVDIGFIDSFKPHVFENLKNDLKLIYER